MNSRDPNREVFGHITTRVINLDRRPDRWESVSQNLSISGVQNFDRVAGFDGTLHFPELSPLLAGSIGCELSHLAALSAGIPSSSEALMICEDDFDLIGSPSKLSEIVEEFLADPKLESPSV